MRISTHSEKQIRETKEIKNMHRKKKYSLES
jgi:hypothetical protein